MKSESKKFISLTRCTLIFQHSHHLRLQIFSIVLSICSFRPWRKFLVGCWSICSQLHPMKNYDLLTSPSILEQPEVWQCQPSSVKNSNTDRRFIWKSGEALITNKHYCLRALNIELKLRTNILHCIDYRTHAQKFLSSYYLQNHSVGDLISEPTHNWNGLQKWCLLLVWITMYHRICPKMFLVILSKINWWKNALKCIRQDLQYKCHMTSLLLITAKLLS